MTAALELVGGLIGLVVAGSAIVNGATTIGRRLGLSRLVIGLTIVAAGTSAPELAVSWQAASDGEPGLAMGNVVGSNIANILLVLGIVAVISAINVTRQAVVLDTPVMIGASILVFVLGLDGTITQVDGFVLVICLVTYITTTVLMSRRTGPAGDAAAIGADGTASTATDDQPTSIDGAPDTVSEGGVGDDGPAWVPAAVTRAAATFPGALVVFAIGAVGVAVAANFVVSGAGSLALSWGMSELVVGLTVVAIGTSAPEIATSTIAAFRGDADVALGNAIGSNVFNLLFVLGLVSAGGNDLPVDDALRDLNFPVMLAVAVLALPYAITRLQIDRIEGGMFLLIYVTYTTYVVLDGTDNAAADEFGIVALAVVTPLALLVIGASLISGRRRTRTDAQPVS